MMNRTMTAIACFAALCALRPAAAHPAPRAIDAAYPAEIRPLIERYCRECHDDVDPEADIDLSAFTTMAHLRRDTRTWVKVGEMLDSGQMPPRKADQPTEAERARLREWVHAFLTAEAKAHAGDPGRVVLRRLSNAEYTYTLRDLTGVESLDPAEQFPVDGAAGEGFTNTGAALVMSPALVTKYLDAAKAVAEHAVLMPDGFRFSEHTTRRDWTNDALAEIRAFYARYTDSGGGERVNLQGVVFDTNQGGLLPVKAYLAATIEEREPLTNGTKTIETVAAERGLSAKYLGMLWRTLTAPTSNEQPALLLDALRARWRTATAKDVPAIAADIARRQQTLWRFNTVGHIGREGAPTRWMDPVAPLASRREFRVKLPDSPDGKDVVVYLLAGDAGDGSDGDTVVWERPRLVMPGRGDLPLRDVRPLARRLAAEHDRLVASAARCLRAADEALHTQGELNADALAAKHGVEPQTLRAWLDYLGIGQDAPAKLGTPITERIESGAGYDFIKGWVGADALSVVANSSDQHVRIPGNMKPNSIAVHPAPTLSVAVGWRAKAPAALRIEGAVQHAHPECGNGVTFTLELRRGNTRQRLAAGVAHGPNVVSIGPLADVAVRPGDAVCLVINPRDGNHSCDLTAIDLTLSDGQKQWNMAKDLSPDILAGNPHGDSHGQGEVWHFFSEPAGGAAATVVPAGSLLAKWQAAGSADDRAKLADALQHLLQTAAADAPKDSPDAALYRELTRLGGPLMSAAMKAVADQPPQANEPDESPYGLEPSRFGDDASIVAAAPHVIAVRLPANLAAGAEFVTTGTLHPASGREGSVQLSVMTRPFDPAATPPAPDAERGPWHDSPVITLDDSPARRRIEAAFNQYRDLFPVALCYVKIVPVDEVVTLTLFHREDEHLRRLMLDDEQAARLDQLWDQLDYVSHHAFMLMDAYEQLVEYATQDRPDLAQPFAVLRKPMEDRVAAFEKRLIDTEPRHLDALIDFAGRAYRRPLSDSEAADLRGLYTGLRKQELPHDEAFRLTLARIFVSPQFLYRLEQPVAGAAQGPVTSNEVANRLSYFLWSSMPDDELRRLADAGRLADPDVLMAQARRMIRDPKARRLAVEFACQWLHIHGFDTHDEKSERHFPTFASLREAMYEEAILFFTDLFQNDRSVLSLIDADHTFLNESLAGHYGIPGVSGAQWRRVDDVRRFARGGMLAFAATLSKQSGASRTSPILRGNWLSEVVLGEKLPRPPKNVPQLDDAPPQGLTERQLIERHSSDPACAKCHARIDPFGFSLENFDAIGRFRVQDAAGLDIDPRTTLPDGTALDGLTGLQQYLLTARREQFVRQFNRKLLGYALGRSVQLSDMPLLDEMHEAMKADGYRVGIAVEKIVRSRQFREIRGTETAYDE